MKKKSTALVGLALVAGLVLSGCAYTSDDLEERESLQDLYKTSESLELTNLKEKRAREDDPEQLRYLYVMNFGQIVGYYVTKGKVSSNGSQIAPEQDLLKPYDTSSERIVVDSAQDDGSYGTGDPGIFFFTADGAMIVTDLNYIQSDVPLKLDVPRLVD